MAALFRAASRSLTVLAISWTWVLPSLKPKPARSQVHTRVLRATVGWTLRQDALQSPRPAVMITVGEPDPMQLKWILRPSGKAARMPGLAWGRRSGSAGVATAAGVCAAAPSATSENSMAGRVRANMEAPGQVEEGAGWSSRCRGTAVFEVAVGDLALISSSIR